MLIMIPRNLPAREATKSSPLGSETNFDDNGMFPVKSKDNVTEQGWLVQKIMLPKSPPPLAEFQIYLQELIA